jgi:sulfur relay (sulfurtransferase) DsrC/TusE family protein
MTWLPKFCPPTVLTSPIDPVRQRETNEILDLRGGLRNVSTWAGELADLLKRQWLHGEFNQDLVDHARELVNFVRKEHAEFEQQNPPN